jgi:tripartite-type tricarboxylate transporter receptor subunit TctC
MAVPRSLLLAVFAATLIAVPLTARADYPDRPITAIVPFAPGGPADIIGRILSTFMPQTLGQSVVIENRGGAAGNIGMGQAARAIWHGITGHRVDSLTSLYKCSYFSGVAWQSYRNTHPGRAVP